MVRVSKVSDNGRVHCVLGGENRRVPWIQESQVPRPGRLMKGKLLEKAIFLVVICCRFSLSLSVLRMLGTTAEENERQVHVLGKLHKEHLVWLWLRPSEPNWKPTYMDGVVIGHHYLPRHPENVSSIRGRNIWWRMETQMMASTFGSDIYKTIHVIVLQTLNNMVIEYK